MSSRQERAIAGSMGRHSLGCLAFGTRPGGDTDRLGDLELKPDPPGRLVGSDVRGGLLLIRGSQRDRALAGLLVGTAPFWFLTGHILMATRPAFDRHVPPGWPTKVFSPLAMPLADLEARWCYPERTPGKWVTMVGARASNAQAHVTTMDRHVDASLARLGQSATWPIVCDRGPLFGLRKCAICDMAIGSEVGSNGRRGDDGLTDLDRLKPEGIIWERN